ncbi:hypothetical protein SDC9_81282 [bioreactor metagenome]|uniref:Uncharacterized protein n=1 Tax=bioreactor metagenome TaxID=1076179 RepID=A0A644Z1C8_9ZZZZ
MCALSQIAQTGIRIGFQLEFRKFSRQRIGRIFEGDPDGIQLDPGLDCTQINAIKAVFPGKNRMQVTASDGLPGRHQVDRPTIRRRLAEGGLELQCGEFSVRSQ